MFDQLIDRRGTNSAKWEEAVAAAQSEEVIPLSVAEMDFRTSPDIIEKLKAVIEHGIYGYTNVSDQYYPIVQQWMKNHYQWEIKQDWIVFCPRIIQAVSLIIQNFTIEQDCILIQTPLYSPLKQAIELNNQKVVENPLIFEKGQYKLNLDLLEEQLSKDVKIMLFCSPHNPTGKVWDEQDLADIARLCKKYHVLLVSDEVHADFIFNGTHTSAGSISEIQNNVVVCTSPAKTFNLPGLEAANILIPNKKIRDKFQNCLRKNGFLNPNYLAVPALETAYVKGDAWLNEVKAYIQENLDYVKSYFAEHLPFMQPVHSEGTFLMWIDCTKSGLAESALQKWFYEDAKVAVSMGSSFGDAGEGFIRMNIATPKEQLQVALERLNNTNPCKD